MADIAFLLLIFFLVTSMIPNDKGIARKLPQKCPPGTICDTDIAVRNLFQIYLNETGELLVNNQLTPIDMMGTKLVAFIDNNGSNSCHYCTGAQLATSSEHPNKAVISLSTHRLTPYSEFIRVHDEITKAYNELRTNYMTTILKKEEDQLTTDDLHEIKEAYPFLISEAVLK